VRTRTRGGVADHSIIVLVTQQSRPQCCSNRTQTIMTCRCSHSFKSVNARANLLPGVGRRKGHDIRSPAPRGKADPSHQPFLTADNADHADHSLHPNASSARSPTTTSGIRAISGGSISERRRRTGIDVVPIVSDGRVTPLEAPQSVAADKQARRHVLRGDAPLPARECEFTPELAQGVSRRKGQ